MKITKKQKDQLANLTTKHLVDFASVRAIKSRAKSRVSGEKTPENLKTIHKIEERVVSINNHYGEAVHHRLVKDKIIKETDKTPVKVEHKTPYERIGKGDVLLKNINNGGLYIKVHKNLAHTFPNYLSIIWTDADFNVITYEKAKEYIPSKNFLENNTTKKQEDYGLAIDRQVDCKTYRIENVLKLSFKVVKWSPKKGVDWKNKSIPKSKRIDKKVVLSFHVNQVPESLRSIITNVKRSKDVETLMETAEDGEE